MVLADTIRLLAAGSLRAALTEAARAFEDKSGGQFRVEAEFAASGLLRERIESGEPAHVFASADLGHPARLAAGGFAQGNISVFARNRLCALVREDLEVTPDTLLETMLAENVRVGISTPKADPCGDYTFALFARAEAHRPGARARLERKALQLTGGPTSEKPPAGCNSYAWVMASGKADLFLTYHTNAVLVLKELPSLRIVPIPRALDVGAEYGLAVLKGAPAPAALLARFILGDEGQAILACFGFGASDAAHD
jgi:ABC-type molybdate transport system substrate-binding protein